MLNSSGVFIVIPNWNGFTFISECLNSLQQVDYESLNIIVVDNGSSDGSISMLRDKYPGVTVLCNDDNFGFAAACNKGIGYSIEHGADFVLLLNNDTVVAPDFLSKMVGVIESDERVGIVGSKILYFDDPQKIWFAGGDFVRWRASGKHRSWMKIDNDNLSGVVGSDFVTGCNILIRREVFDDVGFLYEPYFLTVEDLDFCVTARDKGWKIMVNLDAEIFHKVSLSRDGEFSFSNGYYGTRNRLFFAFRRSRYYFAGLILLLVILPIRFVQWGIDGKIDMVRGAFYGVCDFFYGKMGEKIGKKSAS